MALLSTTLAYGIGFSALMLGIAQAMLDALKDLALTKTQRERGADAGG